MRLRPSLSFANITSILALTIATSGGVYAATELPHNSVGTEQLKQNSVVSTKVRDRSLLAKDFKRGQLPRGARGPRGSRGLQGLPGPSVGYTKTVASTSPTCTTGLICTVTADGPILPAGAYALFVKFFARLNENDQNTFEMTCTVAVGSDSDSTKVTFMDQSSTYAEAHPVTLQVVHTFTEPGTPVLTCQRQGVGGVAGVMNLSFIAVRLGGVA